VSFTKIKLTLCSNFVLTANLASIIGGAAYSWTSPVLPKLNDVDNMVDNPFGRPITPFEESWITSIISVGAAIGPLLAATVMDRIGRKEDNVDDSHTHDCLPLDSRVHHKHQSLLLQQIFSRHWSRLRLLSSPHVCR
jgi:MFS family permease